MGCIKRCARITLGVTTTIIGLLWLVIAVLGGLLAWGQPFVRYLITKYLHPNIDALSNQLGGSGSKIDLSAVIELVLSLGYTIGIILFVTGVILVVICFCGLFGVCFENRLLLKTFGGSLIVLITVEAIVMIIFSVNPDLFFNPARNGLTKTAQKYAGSRATNPESILWNLIQPWLQCCGSVNATDFNSPPGTWDHFYTGTHKIEFPISCCRMGQNFTDPRETSCAEKFTDENSYIKTPCFGKIKGLLINHTYAVMYAFIGVLSGQTLSVILAFVIAILSWKPIIV